jgi:hypothetical protein
MIEIAQPVKRGGGCYMMADIGDDEGALQTYQKVTAISPYDLTANNALANLYERRYRSER